MTIIMLKSFVKYINKMYNKTNIYYIKFRSIHKQIYITLNLQVYTNKYILHWIYKFIQINTWFFTIE